MQYVVGVDAGGTSTTAVAYRYDDGTPLGRGTGGFGNVVVDFEQAMEHLEEAISQAVAGLTGECRLILIGAAGAITGGINGKIIERLQARFTCPVAVDTDARLALEGALEGGDGVLVISGTGSIAQARKGSKLAWAGGWGYLVGDEGSGYDLVAQVIRQMTRDSDMGWPEKPVCRAVREFFNAKDAREVVRFIHSHVKADIAAAAPVVVRCAQEGDPDARAILTKAGEELAKLVICLVRRLQLSSPFPLALQGSVLRKVPQVRERMLAALEEAGLSYKLLPLDTDLTRGAIYYARALDAGAER
jgi:N-acetylglucosamine kinase-like BadF-type ATPase